MKVVFVIGLFLFGILIGFGIFNVSFTGKAIVENEYTYTTAVCDENSCVDVLVSCDNGNVIEMELQSDLKEFDENWTDIRLNQSVYCQ